MALNNVKYGKDQKYKADPKPYLFCKVILLSHDLLLCISLEWC